MSVESLRDWPALDSDVSMDASTDIRPGDEPAEPSNICANARVFSPQDSLRIHQVMRRAGYELGRLLDEHENCLVHLAQSIVTGENMVAKVIVHRAYSESSALVRFQMEAAALARFAHPNLVRVTDHGADENVHYMILEYAGGVNLAKWVARLGPLTARMAIAATTQAALALAYLHGQGVIHRDVKPANLIVAPTGRVMLIDLGLSRMSDGKAGSVTRLFNDTLLGTADYMAPEQALDCHQVDPRTDVYALGCTLYFLLAGRAPFYGDSLAARLMEHQACIPPAVQSGRGTSERLAAICLRMMAKEPAERFQSATDVVQELAQCAS